MTREEAKKWTFDRGNNIWDVVDNHINKIYDDFESRTCGTCKYKLGETCGYYDIFKFNDGFCDKWRAKQNERDYKE